MAMEALQKKALVLAIEEGMDAKGQAIVKRYTYSNIKKAATADNLYKVAQALLSLYAGSVYEVTTVDTNDLVN